MQIYRPFRIAVCFVHNHEPGSVHEEDRAAVSQTAVARVLGHENLDVAFRLPQQGLRPGGLEIPVPEREGVMVRRGPEPVSPLHHFLVSGVDV